MDRIDHKNRFPNGTVAWSDYGPATDENPIESIIPQISSDPRETKALKKPQKGRKVSLYFALALVFVRVSMLHQLLEYLLHTDTYLLYAAGIPVVIAIFSTGGFRHAFKYTSAKYWAAFVLWLIPTTIFSTYKSGSLTAITGYYKTELIILLAVIILISNWREFRLLMYTISAAAMVNVVSVLLFREIDQNGRTSLAFGTVANSNDYSGHLIFVLPFLLWVTLVTRSNFVRIILFFVLVVALFEILAAGSRGAMLGLATAVIVFVLTTTPKIRKIVLITAPILAVVVISLLPHSVSHRIFAFSTDESEAPSEAMGSSRDREQLLKDSIILTIKHPLFGVGPGQFSNAEGEQTANSKERLWYGTHNSFTQIASENGLPGVVFYLGGILASLLLLNKINRRLSGRPGAKETCSAVICIRIALISSCVTMFFLNFGYFYYLPFLGAMAIAMAESSKEFAGAPIAKKRAIQENLQVLRSPL
jgi:O-antigen ligase